MITLTILLPVVAYLHFALSLAPSDVAVKHVKILGEQSSIQLEDRVFRDGGHSVAIGGKIVWLFDDTSSVTKRDHKLLSFVSNSMAYASDPDDDIGAIEDLGDNRGDRIDHTWIPFTEEEKQYNDAHKGKERIAICTFRATSPTTGKVSGSMARLIDKLALRTETHGADKRRAWDEPYSHQH